MISFHSGVDCLDVCLRTTKSLFSAACARLSILKYRDILQSEARRALLFEAESTRHGAFKWCGVKYKVYEKVVLEDSPSIDMDSSFKSFVLLWSVTLLPLEAVNRAEWFVIAAQQGELNPINLLLHSCQFCVVLIFLLAFGACINITAMIFSIHSKQMNATYFTGAVCVNQRLIKHTFIRPLYVATSRGWRWKLFHSWSQLHRCSAKRGTENICPHASH